MKPARACPEYHRRGFVQIVIIAVIALVVGAGAMYGYQKLTTKPSPSPSPTDRSITLTEPTSSPADETVNWKTYIDKKFQIKYPNSWELKVSVFEEKGTKVAGFSPGILTLKSSITCPEIFNRAINGGPNVVAEEVTMSFGQTPEVPTKLTKISEAEMQIGQDKWNLLVWKSFYEGFITNKESIWYPHEFCLQKGNKIFLISFYEPTTPTQNMDLYKQILSTFKFLE